MIAKLKKFIREEKTILIILGIAYVLLVLIMTKTGSGDLDYFAGWIDYFVKHGLTNSYSAPTLNYLPTIVYFLNLFGWGMTLARINIDKYMYLIKPFLLFLNLASVIVVMLLSRRYKIPTVYSLLIFFNIAFLYDSYLWGQLDIFVDFFVLLALYFSLVKKPTAAAIAYLMALNCKPQAFPFLPFFLILIGLQIPNRKQFFKLIIILLAVQLILILPFVIFGQGASLLNVLASTTGYFPTISDNALNIWVLFFPHQYAAAIPDTNTFLGVTYRFWGLFMFGVSSLVVLIPVLKRTLRLRKTQFDFKLSDLSFYALSVCLIAFNFFMLTTQMHERYLDAAIVFAGIYAISSRRYLFYILISFVYFLNLNLLLGHFELQILVPIFTSAHAIASMMLVAFLLGWYEFARITFLKKKLLSH